MHVFLNWLWQGAVVAAALFVMLRALDHARANVRYIVCGVALLIVLAIPVLPWLPLAADAPPLVAHSAIAPVVSIPAAPWTSVVPLLVLWSLWAGAQSVRLLRAFMAVRRVRRTIRPFPTDVKCRLRHWMRICGERRGVRLVVSDAVGPAAVLGCGAPMIAVAPALVERLTPDELDYVVMHEWAHVQRRDDLASLLQFAVRVIAGWHPAMWWIDRRLQVEREVACDEMAVDIVGAAKPYATCLVKLADLVTASRVPLAASGMSTATGLRIRVTRIVSGRVFASTIRSHGVATAVVAVLLALAAGISGFELVATTAMVSERTEPAFTRDARINPAPEPPVAQPDTSVAAAREGVIERGIDAVSPVPVQRSTTDTVPADEPRPSPPIAPQVEPDVPQPQAETADAAAIDGSPAVLDAAQLPLPATTLANQVPSDPRSPWGVAADAGVAIGRGSKTAGVATAGFFTRVARRVASSF